MKIFSALVLIGLFPSFAESATLRLPFGSDDFVESSTLVINPFFEALHPTLRVVGFADGNQLEDFSVGDGSLGALIPSRFSEFDQDGNSSNQVLVIDTDRFPRLTVTEFHLPTGWVLRTTGQNPLKIESLGPVLIEGLIDCRGEDGSPSVGGQGGQGGSGHCGGGHGGDGGDAGASGISGSSPRAEIDGGRSGIFTGGPAVGGGGGGSWNRTSLPGNGVNWVPGSGQAGVSVTDPAFQWAEGSAGGGGGSGSLIAGGGGGGGAGGAVIIHAVGDVSLGVNGEIRVDGGTGGDSASNGGPGGGGGGGSVKIFSGGTLSVLNPNGAGAIRAPFGNGGTNTSLDAGANGGSGRNWLAAITYNLVGFYTPAEEGTFLPGDVSFSDQEQIFETTVFDLQSTGWGFTSITTLPSSTEYRFEGSGSERDDADSFSPWSEDFSSLQSYRYLRFRISLRNTKGNQADFLEEISFNYSPNNLSQFDFTSAGCGRIGFVPPSGTPLILFLFPIALLLFLKRRQNHLAS